MLNMNMSGSSLLTVAGGYPVRLYTAGDNTLQGVIRNTVVSLSAVVKPEAGTANAHLAIFSMPTTSGGNDNAVVAQTDLALTGSSQQTITVAVPSGSPTCYVARLWVDSITGANMDTISRDGSTAVANEPVIPVAVTVYSVTAT